MNVMQYVESEWSAFQYAQRTVLATMTAEQRSAVRWAWMRGLHHGLYIQVEEGQRVHDDVLAATAKYRDQD
jgi:hypothetical protein